jgi:uncharacterized lipoprotein
LATSIKRHIAAVRHEGQGAIDLFYYSGHGAANPETKVNYLIPVGRITAAASNWLSARNPTSKRRSVCWRAAAVRDEDQGREHYPKPPDAANYPKACAVLEEAAATAPASAAASLSSSRMRLSACSSQRGLAARAGRPL